MYTDIDLEDNFVVKMLLQVKYIPNGTVVTKLNGKKEYEVSDIFAVYDDKGNKTPINLDDGCKFLLACDGPSTGVNVISSDKYLLCHFDPETAISIIEEMAGL